METKIERRPNKLSSLPPKTCSQSRFCKRDLSQGISHASTASTSGSPVQVPAYAVAASRSDGKGKNRAGQDEAGLEVCAGVLPFARDGWTDGTDGSELLEPG